MVTNAPYPFTFRSPVAFSRFVDEPRVNSADGLTSNGIQLRNYKVNANFVHFSKFLLHNFTCLQDYFYWFSSPLKSNASFICESPQLSIGCLSEPGGAGYNGTAARGESGQECLSWSTPGLTSIFPGQGGWEHNHCRNPDGSEESPICYIEPDLYDYCQIPDCETVRRREANRCGCRKL